MPKLPGQWIAVKGEDGTEFLYEAAVHVDSTGLFSLSVDGRLIEIAEKFNPRHCTEDVVWLARRSGVCCVQSKSLYPAAEFLKKCAQDYLSCKVETVRVILYRYDLDVAFWQEKGRILPNGAVENGGSSAGNWFEPGMKHRDGDAGRFSIGLAAVVFDKKTYLRASGNVIKWERVRESEDDEADSAVCRLNSFCTSIDPESDGYHEMPYSAEAALFFTDATVSLCKLAERMDQFFGEPATLELAIKNRQKFLPGKV